MNRKLQLKLMWGRLQGLYCRIFFIGALASSVLVSACVAQAAQGGAGAAGSQPTVSSPAPYRSGSAAASPKRRFPFLSQMPDNVARFYRLKWGADSFSVKSVESGEMIRFSYRVLDAGKAKPLNDKQSEPYLIDVAANVKLVVPEVEKIGKLRQSVAPEAGKVYWMVFSNKGGYVKRGDRVSVTIGRFRVDGLVVE